VGGTAPYDVEWRLNSMVISEAEDPDNLPAGEYQLIIVDFNGCEFEFSVTIEFVPVNGTQNTSKAIQSFKIVPNPTSGALQVVFSAPLWELVDVKILDVLGKAIYQQQHLAQQGTYIPLDLSNYTKGVYFVQLSFAGETTTRKVVLQ